MNYQNWEGTEDTRYGYGSMLDGFIKAAPKTVKFDPKASVSVYMGVPFGCKGWLKGTYRVCSTMWETTELPFNFTHYLPLYDHIIVPNDIEAEMFGRHHKKVDVVPLGVDTSWYKPIDVPRHNRFQFRAGGSLWARKGLDVTIKAFEKLNLPDADLRIKIAPHARDMPDTKFGPNIYFDTQWMTEEQKGEWFAGADCFIAASRGEGFGLMPLQTIAMAVPTIVSLTTGQIQFSHLATGTVSCAKEKSSTVGYWDEPNVDELAEQMLHHYRNREQVRTQAVINSVEAEDFSWKKATAKLLKVLPTGTLFDGEIHEKPNVIFKVQAIKRVTADIGNRSYRHSPGDIFDVTKGDYQVLSDAGVVKLP